MKLSEIFKQLSYGELSQLNVGGSGSGAIADADYDRLVSCINLGLTALHTRFPLKRKTLSLKVVPGQSIYRLHSDFATSNDESEEAVKYILDSADDPFLDDILKVEAVFTAEGVELVLNSRGNSKSVFTPSHGVLTLPADIHSPTGSTESIYLTESVVVDYRANHPIMADGVGMYLGDTVEVDLPYQYLQPLLYFVASRLHNPLGMSNEFHMGNSFAAKYELACRELETHNVGIDQLGDTAKFSNRGWV